MTPQLICVAGQYRNGKNALGEAFLPLLPKHSPAAFAAKPYQLLTLIMRCSYDFLMYWKERNVPPPGWNMTVRQAMQRLATEARAIDEDVWIKQWLPSSYPLVFMDGRFENELRAVKANGGVNVLVFRPGYLNHDPHPSEAFVGQLVRKFLASGANGLIPMDQSDLIDYFFINDGEHPRDLAKSILEALIERCAGRS